MTKERSRIPIYAFHPIGAEFHVTQPLALGMIVEQARLHPDVSVSQRYDFRHGLIYSLTKLGDAIRADGPGICLFSNYQWTLSDNLRASARVKTLEPRCITIHGGPSTPKYPTACEKFLHQHRHVDIAVRGEGESAILELLPGLTGYFEGYRPEAFDELRRIGGLTFLNKSKDGLTRTDPDRPLIKELDGIPSPYLTDFFDKYGWRFDTHGWAKGIAKAHGPLLIFETNRGCPYGCTFCDWGSLTLQKIRTFDLTRVRAELEWMAQHEVDSIFMADANFGILPRDLEIARMMAETKERFGYPNKVIANYSKNGNKRLPEIFDVWKSAGIQFPAFISIQTTDKSTLNVIRRSNIKTSDYMALSRTYRAMELDVQIQLMLGLPGATVESWKNDLQFFFDQLQDPQVFITRMLPNSPMADPAYIEEYAIELGDGDIVLSCRTFSRDDHRTMRMLTALYHLCSTLGVLRWFLLHLQWDHGIRALDFMHGLIALVRRPGVDYPELRSVFGPLCDAGYTEENRSVDRLVEYFESDGWMSFYADVKDYIQRELRIVWTSAMEAAILLQNALRPARSRIVGPTHPVLSHDAVAYFVDAVGAMEQGTLDDHAPLLRYPSAELIVTDPRNLCDAKPAVVKTLASIGATKIGGFELESRLSELTGGVFWLEDVLPHDANATDSSARVIAPA